MDDGRTNHHWIRPLLSELDLLGTVEETHDPGILWKELEESGFLERLRQLVPVINKEAGYPLLHVQWFLPPQKVVCTFTIRKPKTEFGMQIVLRKAGPIVVFYNKKPRSLGEGGGYGLYRYLGGSGGVNVKLRRVIRPSEVTDQDFQEWFSFLLSGFQDSFQPSMR
jgi:hypothetical protein